MEYFLRIFWPICYFNLIGRSESFRDKSSPHLLLYILDIICKISRCSGNPPPPLVYLSISPTRVTDLSTVCKKSQWSRAAVMNGPHT